MDFLKYLKYVTIADAWDATKTWLFIAALLLALVLGGDYLVSRVSEQLGDVPRRIYFFIAFATVMWFLRGKTLTFPKSKGMWLFTVLFFGAVTVVSFYLPVWGTILAWFLSVMTIFFVATLAMLGEENYRKLYGGEDDDSGA